MKTVHKPWGKEEWLELNDKYCYKRIYINAGHKTSYQYHDFKRETNYLISGTAEIWLENDEGEVKKTIMNAGEYFNVTPPKKHRVIAITDIILQEVSTPEVDDVIRIEDDSNRPDGRLEHEHKKPALCILTAGVGSRLKHLAKHTNKGLLPLGNKAIISHMIEKTPVDYDIIIVLGYKGDVVKEYCEAAHPDRKFIFVTVDKYLGDGTGPGYSIKQAKEYLQRPFIWTTSDTIVLDELPKVNINWLGVYPTSVPELYSTVNIKDGDIIDFKNKSKEGYNHAFIGLAGVYDYSTFWEQLDVNEDISWVNRKGTNMGEGSEIVSAYHNVNKYTAIKPKEFDWYDIGTVENYIKAQKSFTTQKYGIPKTNGQFLYKVNNMCVKMFQESVDSKCHRADNLGDLVPTINYKGNNIFSYDWIDGKTLYESKLDDKIKFIDWVGKEIKTFQESDVDISADCQKFYINKTRDRLEKYLEYAPNIMQGELVINSQKYKSINYYLDQIDVDLLCNTTIPTIKWHGDMQFDNIIKTAENFKFIDWRDTFGDSIDYGDAYYDLAKLYGGICMNYSYMKDEKNYSYIIESNCIEFSFRTDKVESKLLHQKFKRMVKDNGYSYNKIKTLTALIYLNMAPLHEKRLDHLLFANAITLLDKLND
tara:strand:+ start:6704 stop:8647 length:1944 start_codon:yes stop_codon:yes gene_type:complete